MNTHADPYAAPAASLDNSKGAEPILSSPWSAKGRLGVLSYFAHSVVLLLVSIPAMAVVIGLVAALSGGIPETPGDVNLGSPVNVLAGIVLVALFIAFMYVSTCMLIKRLHDRNHSGWWSLALFIASAIPFVNLVALVGFLYVLCWPGQKNGNRFGGQRATKGWEKIVGIIYLAIVVASMVFGVIAGIGLISGAV